LVEGDSMIVERVCSQGKLLWTAGLASLLLGCGGGSAPNRPTVHAGKGQVTIDGAAAKTGQVTFTPIKSDPKQPGATGKIGSDGSFTFSTFDAADGIAAGEFDATLRPDPTLMTGVPAVKPVRVTIKANASGQVDPVAVAFESVKGAKPASSATLIGTGGGAAPPGPGMKRP